MSAPDLEEQERSAGRRRSDGGVDSRGGQVGLGRSNREHHERLSRILGVTEPGGFKEGWSGLASHIPSNNLDKAHRGPTLSATDLERFGVAGDGKKDPWLRRKPVSDKGFRGAGPRERGGGGSSKGPRRLPRL